MSVLWLLALLAFLWLIVATVVGVVVGVFLRRARQIAEIEDFIGTEVELREAASTGNPADRSLRWSGPAGRRYQRRWGRPA